MKSLKRLTSWKRIVGMLLLACLLINACGAEPSPTPPPTKVAQPPTNTPFPPTDTPTPQPTATPTPRPTATPIPTAPFTSTPISTPTVDLAKVLDLIMEAETLYRQGDYQGTVEICTELLAISQSDKDQIHAYVLRADAYEQLKDFPSAIADYVQAVELGEDEPDVLRDLCWDYAITEQPELGLPFCEQAVAADPSLSQHDSRGVTYALLDRIEEAIADLQIVVDLLAEAQEPELVAIRDQRAQWLDALKAGQNPLTPEMLAGLRGEPTPTPLPPTVTPTRPAVVTAPQPTAKSNVGKILFTSNRVSWDDIFVMDDDGTNVKRLTTMGRCYDAHFSPDGKRIVFAQGGDIWIMNADGGAQANLTDTSEKIEAFPVFSADGKRIAYLFAWSGGFEIYTMNTDGTDQKSITSGNLDWMPSWQPDGTKIAFSSARSGLFNIWTVSADGSNLKQVTTFVDFGALSPVWSSDGKQIGMVRYAGNSWEIWVVNADGSNPHRVTQIVGGDDGFIPDMGGWQRGRFVFGGYHGNWDVAVVPETGGETSFLTDDPKDDKPSDWWVATDGSASPAPISAPIPTPIPTQPPTPAGPYPDFGGRIAFSAGGLLHLVDAKTGQDTITSIPNMRQPDFRVDGDLIIVNGEGGGRDSLWTVRASGGLYKEQGTHPEEGYPFFSPMEPGQFVYASTHMDGHDHLFIGNLDKPKEARAPLAFGGGLIIGTHPIWLHTDRIVYSGCDYGFGNGNHCGLFQVPSWGGVPAQIFAGGAADRATDGFDTKVLLTTQRDGNWELYLVDSGGSGLRNLSNCPGSNDGLGTFSADGKWVAFVSNRGGDWAVWVVRPDGFGLDKLFDLSAPLTGNWLDERISWGP